MSQWPTTQLSQGGNPLAAEILLKDVKHLIEQPEFSLELIANREPYTDKTKQYAELIVILSDMLSSFPKADGGTSEQDLDRAVDIARLALDAIERVGSRMEGALAGEEKALTANLLVGLSIVDGWDAQIGPRESIVTLREIILRVLIKGFRHRVEETFMSAPKFENGILVVSACIKEMLSSAHYIMESEPELYPLSISVFDQEESGKRQIRLASPHHGILFSSSLLHGLGDFLQGISPPTFWANISQETVNAAILLFEVALKSNPVKMRDYLARLLPISSTLIRTSPLGTKGIQPYLFQVVATRADHFSDEVWNALDNPLTSALDVMFQASILTGDFIGHGLELLSNMATNEPEQSTLILTYLAHYAIRCPISSLGPLRSMAEKMKASSHSELLLRALESRQGSSLSSRTTIDGYHHDDWQNKSMAKMRDGIFNSRGFELMDIDGEGWQLGVIHQVNALFSSPLLDTSKEARVAMAKHLLELPNDLVPPQDSDTQHRTPYPLAPLYILATARLLDGPSNLVDADVRRVVYNAFAKGLQCHCAEKGSISGIDLKSVVKSLETGYTYKSRPVRLAAGRVLAELFSVSQDAEEPTGLRMNSVISYIRTILSGRQDHLKETTLITLGVIGRVANPDILAEICFILINHVGHPNPLLRGVAFLQLVTLARRAKSPYNLIAPDLPRIGLYIASNCYKHPLLMQEFCRFISYSPSSFLSQALLHYLPTLVAKCADEELKTIARIMMTTVAALIVDKPAEVLETVFMQDSVQKTEASLDFILHHLPRGSQSGNRSFELSSLVKSKLVSLLARLVIQLGDQSGARERALSAIEKVERYAGESRPSSKRAQMSHQAFLQLHIMGIVSHLNSELQEAHGKRSIDAKSKVLRGIQEVLFILGNASTVVSPQLVTIMQNTIRQTGLAGSTLETWHTLATVLNPTDFVPYLALTSAIFAESWTLFNPSERNTAKRTLAYIIGNSREFKAYINSLAFFGDIEELNDLHQAVTSMAPKYTLSQKLEILCLRIADSNASVSHLAVIETKRLISDHKEFSPLVSGDNFDPVVGSLVKALQTVSGREGEAFEASRMETFECLGIIGALDPDRFDIPRDEEDPLITFADFEDEKHSQAFATHMIGHVLAPVFPKTSDIKFQSLLAYTIQELLSFCGFTVSLMTPDNMNPVSIKVQKRWKTLSDEVRSIVVPLLSSKFAIEGRLDAPESYPIYATAPTYKEWIQKFSSYLISQVRGKFASRVFTPFRVLLGSADVQVLLFLMPHLVLDVLSIGSEVDAKNIHGEIISVLEDQVNPAPGRSAEMRLLCAQTIFQLMDHLNKYLRYTGILLAHPKRAKSPSLPERHRIVESLMTNIDHSLMAQAAFKCKQYARALMSLEQRVQAMRRNANIDEALLQVDYDKMHELYANLDEPDGMNGISSMVLSPTLEHQIREHESTGRWTSAQSCWEVSLQQNPDNLNSQIGLLRCLRNLGHYDTLRTHLVGIIGRNPHWGATLEPFRLEGAWNARDWDTVEEIVSSSQSHSPELSTGKLLLALRSQDDKKIDDALSLARLEFGQPIGAAGYQSYRRTYYASVNLHLVEEMAMISRFTKSLLRSRRSGQTDKLARLSAVLEDRYDSVLPSYRTLEPILSLRRTAFDLLNQDSAAINALVGRYWLASSKIARKAGHFQAAYSSLLQGRERGAPYYFIQGCKLLYSSGESIRALQELNNALALTGDLDSSDIIDLTEDDEETRETRRNKAKARLLRARWMQISGRFSRAELNAQFNHVTQLYSDWEASYFHWALYLDRSQVHKDIPSTQLEEYINHVSHVVRYYGKSLRHGSKHLYQTLPRMLTLWLNLGQREELQTQKGVPTADHANRSSLKKFGVLCDWVREDLVETVDPFKWLTAFPQIVSRLVNNNQVLVRALYTIIGKVIQEFPQQALWIISGVSGSLKRERGEAALRAVGFGLSERIFPKTITFENRERLMAIFQRVGPLATIYSELNKELIRLCNFDVEQAELHYLAVKCPKLAGMNLTNVIVPLQDSFTSRIPPMSSQILDSQPFPHALPTIKTFLQQIQVMPSLQRPRKIGIESYNGDQYHFLCKPKDDLRKDARLMDFNSVVNKLLRANSEARRRQLHIRTYSVVPLNEECGLIEWVRNTCALRALLKRRYDAIGVSMMPKRINDYFEKFKTVAADQAAKTFETKILPEFRPLFHEWFLDTFPEPTAWFASRLNYSRTAAVISMVGYIIGLGDRHCENIMLDESTGDTVHCDFNCLFEKGKTFEIPELVPFRLTQNIIDGMGITGVEGTFRICCEITMQLLRSNQDCLMSVLEAFIHDPLVEWEDERRRKERRHAPVDLKKLALGALNPIERKLQGTEGDTQISVSNQVEKLIQDATSTQKLAKMYIGWTPWV